MTDINLKTLTPDTSLPTTGFLFGADSQASTNPSVYSTQTVATTLLGSTSLTGDTVATSLPVLDLTQTWNSSGTTFTGVRFNAAGSSSTNSAAASLLMDLQLVGVSKFNVTKTGALSVNNGITIGPDSYKVTGLSTTVAIDYGSLGHLNVQVSGANVFSVRSTTNAVLTSTGAFAFGNSGNTANTTEDTFITRKNTRILQLGQADASTALAQTLSVQSVVAGTTNGAGAAFTINGSQGTGTGAGGSIVFQVAPAAGSSSNAQNTLQTALTIDSTKLATFALGASLPAGSTGALPIQISATNYGFYRGATQGGQAIIVTCGGSDIFAVGQNSGIGVVNVGPYTFATSIASSTDLSLSRAAAGVVQVGTTANNASGTLKAAVVGTTTAYTVATLPTGFQGARAFVTDALAPTYLNTLTGGGSVVCPVFYNGSAWVSA